MDSGYDVNNYDEEYNPDDDMAWNEYEGMDPPNSSGSYQYNNGNNFGGGGGRFRNGRDRNFGQGWFGPMPFYDGPGRFGGPQGPPFSWGRGFGPRGPPVQHRNFNKDKIRFLIRCGVPKENLRNIPRELLNLIEPQYCALCGKGFESMAIASLHYVSKNHLKNQKKWLSQKSDSGYHRAKEIPLKSRDLYCELCDVHITSKSHADSHYAGKPHRAIVEGRKMPKNPVLLHKGMQDRVEQLVRREKKHLKPVEEGGAEDGAQEPKETKPLQPELYCDICKTSVTCTEQMTMHLNGKRHLSKEKQHILKMMKGESAAKGEENPDGAGAQDKDAEGTDGAEADGTQAEEKNGGADDNNDDWGDGSGNWDDPQ